jgi:hypothetical protein
MVLRVRTLSSTGDMTFGQGSANYLIDSAAAVSQIVGTSLKLWQTEWFLNLSAGIPYNTQIAGYGNLTMGALILKTAVLAVPGVINIENWNVNYTASTRTYSVSGSNINTVFGTTTFPSIQTIAPATT